MSSDNERSWRAGAALAAAVTSLALGAVARAAEWHVEQAAAPGGDGGAAAPFQRIGDVRDVLARGDTVVIHGGVYQETVDFWHVPEARARGRRSEPRHASLPSSTAAAAATASCSRPARPRG